MVGQQQKRVKRTLALLYSTGELSGCIHMRERKKENTCECMISCPESTLRREKLRNSFCDATCKRAKKKKHSIGFYICTWIEKDGRG